jgi:hypothetical protein
MLKPFSPFVTNAQARQAKVLVHYFKPSEIIETLFKLGHCCTEHSLIFGCNGSFTLATFVSETFGYSDSPQQYLHLPVCHLGRCDTDMIFSIYFALPKERKEGEISLSLSRLISPM